MLAPGLKTLQVAQSQYAPPPPPPRAWGLRAGGLLGHQRHLLVGGRNSSSKGVWLLTGMGVPLSEGGTMSGERT